MRKALLLITIFSLFLFKPLATVNADPPHCDVQTDPSPLTDTITSAKLIITGNAIHANTDYLIKIVSANGSRNRFLCGANPGGAFDWSECPIAVFGAHQDGTLTMGNTYSGSGVEQTGIPFANDNHDPYVAGAYTVGVYPRDNQSSLVCQGQYTVTYKNQKGGGCTITLVNTTTNLDTPIQITASFPGKSDSDFVTVQLKDTVSGAVNAANKKENVLVSQLKTPFSIGKVPVPSTYEAQIYYGGIMQGDFQCSLGPIQIGASGDKGGGTCIPANAAGCKTSSSLDKKGNCCENLTCFGADLSPNGGLCIGAYNGGLGGFDVTNITPTPVCPNNICTTAIGDINTSSSGFIGTIMSFVLSIAGGIALLLIIISGYRLMVSQGNPEHIKNAKDQLTAAIVGLLFVIFSLVILQVIGYNILGLPGFKP